MPKSSLICINIPLNTKYPKFVMLLQAKIDNEIKSDPYNLVSWSRLSIQAIFHDAIFRLKRCFFKTQHPNYFQIFIFTEHSS